MSRKTSSHFALFAPVWTISRVIFVFFIVLPAFFGVHIKLVKGDGLFRICLADIRTGDARGCLLSFKETEPGTGRTTRQMINDARDMLVDTEAEYKASENYKEVQAKCVKNGIFVIKLIGMGKNGQFQEDCIAKIPVR